MKLSELKKVVIYSHNSGGTGNYDDVLFEYLKDKGFNPISSVTNFITFKTGSEEASLFLFNELLNHGVIIRPLRANLMPDHVRISIGTNEEMKHFYQAMNEVLPLYKKQFGVKA